MVRHLPTLASHQGEAKGKAIELGPCEVHGRCGDSRPLTIACHAEVAVRKKRENRPRAMFFREHGVRNTLEVLTATPRGPGEGRERRACPPPPAGTNVPCCVTSMTARALRFLGHLVKCYGVTPCCQRY